MTLIPTDTPLTARQQKAQATKARIAETAMHLFSEQGFAATSTKQIAQEAGVSEGLIFRYFPTKLDLLHSLAKLRSTFAGEVKALLTEAENRPARACLRDIADGFVSLVRSETQFMNLMLGESRTNDDLYEVFRQVIDNTVGSLAAYLDKRVQAGELRRDLGAQSAAQAFFGPLILFFLTNKHLSDELWLEQSRAFVDETLDLWFRGALRDG